MKVQVWLHVNQHDIQTKLYLEKMWFFLFDLHIQSLFSVCALFPEFSCFIQNFGWYQLACGCFCLAFYIEQSSSVHILTSVVDHAAANKCFHVHVTPHVAKTVLCFWCWHYRMQALFAGPLINNKPPPVRHFAVNEDLCSLVFFQWPRALCVQWANWENCGSGCLLSLVKLLNGM